MKMTKSQTARALKHIRDAAMFEECAILFAEAYFYSGLQARALAVTYRDNAKRANEKVCAGYEFFGDAWTALYYSEAGQAAKQDGKADAKKYTARIIERLAPIEDAKEAPITD